MPVTEVSLNFEKLLAPLSAGGPTGPYLKWEASDTTYGKLSEMRRVGDGAVGDEKSADWKGLAKLSLEVLQARSKDLQIAAWLTEALVHLQGFAGLRDGLRLLRELLDRFWDAIHPGLEEGKIDLELRGAPLTWIGGGRDFILAVKRIPVTRAAGLPPRSWYDFEESQRVDAAALKNDQEAYKELIAEGKLTGEDWKKSIGATAVEERAKVVSILGECLGELKLLAAKAEERFQGSGPSLADLESLLQAVEEHLQGTLGGTAETGGSGGAEGADGGGSMGESATGAGAGGAIAGPRGAIGGRAQAFQRLREVADFLRRTEPHSPVPHLIERAIRWGNMSLEEVLEDVIKNDDVKNQLWETLGIQRAAPAEAPSA